LTENGNPAGTTIGENGTTLRENGPTTSV
jgi:hypothetical protein